MGVAICVGALEVRRLEVYIRPCPPTTKIKSKSAALPMYLSSLSVFFQRWLCCLWKVVQTGSSLKSSTEPGSSGASPPAGEATTISA